MANRIRIKSVIVDQLAEGEMRLLRLVVAVRTALGRSEKIKGNLSEIVKSAVRELIASAVIVDADGMYSLAQPR